MGSWEPIVKHTDFLSVGVAMWVLGAVGMSICIQSSRACCLIITSGYITRVVSS